MKDAAHRFIQDVRAVEGKLGRFPSRAEYEANGKYGAAIVLLFGNWGGVERAVSREKEEKDEARTPKILIFDIETRPLEVLAWSLRQDYIPANQIVTDRIVLAFAAKWLGEDKIRYCDVRKNIKSDKSLLQELWKLLDEADLVITKNGKRFDQRVVFGRMAMNRMKPPSPFQHEDIESLFRKHFDLPSFRMDYLAERFLEAEKKSDHAKFPGMKLWQECLKGNPQAWNEMEKYNKQDVVVTEKLREIISPWGPTPGIEYNAFYGDTQFHCRCGSTNVQKRGHKITKAGKFQRYQCMEPTCGAWYSEKGQANNLFTLKKKQQLKKGPRVKAGKAHIRAQIEILEWVVRLTMAGMPLSMMRYYVLKRIDELEKEMD